MNSCPRYWKFHAMFQLVIISDHLQRIPVSLHRDIHSTPFFSIFHHQYLQTMKRKTFKLMMMSCDEFDWSFEIDCLRWNIISRHIEGQKVGTFAKWERKTSTQSKPQTFRVLRYFSVTCCFKYEIDCKRNFQSQRRKFRYQVFEALISNSKQQESVKKVKHYEL